MILVRCRKKVTEAFLLQNLQYNVPVFFSQNFQITENSPQAFDATMTLLLRWLILMTTALKDSFCSLLDI